MRPRLKVHGAWAFGWCVRIFVLDDPARHNSSCICQVIAETIEEARAQLSLRTVSQVMKMAAERGCPPPDCLCIMAARPC